MITDIATIPDDTAIGLGPDPKEIIGYARQIANALMDVVESQGLYIQIGKKKHILAEGWETVISLDMAHPIIESTTPILDSSGDIVAYKARCVIYKAGDAIASGEMICGLEGEFSTNSKEGWGRHRAAMSSAQTWAVAKAGRTKYAWIVALAGYSGTPAEEMQGTNGKTDADSPYWCAEHGTLYFKKGRMRRYAHKVEETDDWHNMPESPAKAPRQPTGARNEETHTSAADTEVETLGAPKEEPATGESGEGPFQSGNRFASLGAFLGRALRELNLPSNRVREALEIESVQEIDFAHPSTWERLVKSTQPRP